MYEVQSLCRAAPPPPGGRATGLQVAGVVIGRGSANDLGEEVVEDEHAGGAEAAEGVGERAVEEAAKALLRRA